MDTIITCERHPIKNGWAARAPALHLTAHGRTEELAGLNLQRVIRAFLTPFQRNGTLGAEAEKLGLDMTGSGSEMQITLVDA